MKRILLVSEVFTVGGLETHIAGAIRQLSGRGSRLILATGRECTPESIPAETAAVVRNLPFGREATSEDLRRSVEELADCIRRYDIDLVHAHPFRSLLPAVLAAARQQVPAVCTLHGPQIFAGIYGGFFDLLLKGVTLPAMAKVYCVSPEVERLAVRYARPGATSVLPNGVDPQLFIPSATPPSGARWAVVSRLDGFKLPGIIDFIGKAKDLPIAGIDIFGDGPNREELAAWLRDNGRADVELKGSVTDVHRRLPAYAGVAGMGRVALEAATLDLPVILLGYDGVKGLLDRPLAEKAAWANFSGRDWPSIAADRLGKSLAELRADPQRFRWRDLIVERFNEEALWAQYARESANRRPLLPAAAAEALGACIREAGNGGDVPYLEDAALEQRLRRALLACAGPWRDPALVAATAGYREWLLDRLLKAGPAWQEKYAAARRAAEETGKALAKQQTLVCDLQAENRTLAAAMAQQCDQMRIVEEHLGFALQRVACIENGWSWRLTQPLRQLKAVCSTFGRAADRATRVARSQGMKALAKKIGGKCRRHLPRLPDQAAEKELDALLAAPTPTIVFLPVIDWNVPLFQRPQHMALNLARQGWNYIYCTPGAYDHDIRGVHRAAENLHITDRYPYLEKLLLERPGKSVVVHCYAQDHRLTADLVDRLLGAGHRILYEYIDAIDDKLSVAREAIMARHIKVLCDERCYVVATAGNLLDEVRRYRGRNFLQVTNGVDFEHFAGRERRDMPEDLAAFLAGGNPVIGYFGALASWFDFDMTIRLAQARPDYRILLLGWDYDGTLARYRELTHLQNVKILGPIPYPQLPRFAAHFDVATIPFLLNDITRATNPIKLFEYMALGLPIVTSDLPECRNYRSALIARSPDEYIRLIDRAVGLRQDRNYRQILRQEALANTWQAKAEEVARLLAAEGVPHAVGC